MIIEVCRRRQAAPVLAGLATLVFATLATVPTVRPAAAEERPRGAGVVAIPIEVGSGRLIRLRGKAANVFAADPKVAEVRPASPSSLFVFGVAEGRTNVVALDAAGQSVGAFTVDITPSGTAARETRRFLQGTDAAGLSVTPGPDGVVLDGVAPTPVAADRAAAFARDAVGKKGTVIDGARLGGSIQVNLRVRIAEMSRVITRELGINWQSAGRLGGDAAFGVTTASPIQAASAAASVLSFSSHFRSGGTTGTLDAVIDALAQDQLVHLLAEPNLTTISGEPASFLVGGEFPIPVASYDNNVTVDFKQYGVSLSFVPTVLSNGAISLHVQPEVSEITSQGAVSMTEANSTIQIPALIVRRADTTVELGSGQSFAIAGLLQDNATLGSNGVPFLGDLPVLGSLFRSDNFQRSQTELVIVVTPYIVDPAPSESALRLPGDDWSPPNDLERILLLRQSARGRPVNTTGGSGEEFAAPIRVPGQAGFLVE